MNEIRFDTATIDGTDSEGAEIQINLTILERDDGKFIVVAPDHTLNGEFASHAAAEDYVLASYDHYPWNLRCYLCGVRL
jgi:hypothetical protein